jgi:hypothetical protein
MKQVRTTSRLVALLYSLLRDHVHPGAMEKIVKEDSAYYDFTLSNEYLAGYAKNIARRVTRKRGT